MNAKTPPETESFDAAELGAMMREMRENLGHELDAVARDLRIRLVYLEAIESGRLTDLPGNAYVSGFLRSYSDFLGLEGDEIVRRFKVAGAEINSQPQLHLPSPVEEGRLPTASILLVAAVIAAAAYGGWYYLSGSGKGTMETVASLPKELSSLVDEAKNQTEPTAVENTPAPPAASSDTGGNGMSDSERVVPQLPAVETPAPEATPSEEPATTSVDSAGTGSDAAPAPAAPATASSENSPPAIQAEPAGDTSQQTPPANATGTSTTPAAATEPVEEQAAVAVTPAPVPPAAVAPAPVMTAPAAPTVSQVPDAPAAAPPAEPAATTAPAAAPAPVSNPSNDQAVRTAAVPPSPRSNPGPVVSGDPAPAAASSTSSEPSNQPSVGGVRIVVRATADSYVAVRTSDNEPLFSQLMRPGDSYEVPSGADLVLETGNAGGLQISVGGKRVPPLGPIGEIRRNIPLNAEKLLSGVN
jgi:cytoskeleton protein RodZ